MNALTGAADQPLPLQRRPELVSREITYARQSYWSVKDPLALRYYQLRDEEHFILSMLDGRTSLLEIQRRFQERFAPRRIEVSQLNWFLGMLHREGLVVAETAEQGRQLLARRRRSQRRQFWSGLSNVLAIRFRGVNPAGAIDRLYPLVRWAFSPWCVAAMLALMVVAGCVLLLELPAALHQLPTFTAFFSAENLIWIALALALAKVFHELGHAFTCRHFGGKCRELGVMLLVFTPCLYCNVSDAWMIPNKWRRIAISAAGIYVEMVLASICLLLWRFSEPGAFHAFCLNLVIVCSVGTVLFNGNPLLRYDGYFMFADWCEMPNLAQRGGQYVRQRIVSLCTGLDTNFVPPAERERTMLVLYTLASWSYRVFIVIGIIWLCHAALKPYGLEPLVVVLTIVTVGGMVAMPFWETASILRDPARRRKLRAARLALVFILVAGLASFAVMVPVTHRVRAPVVLEPSRADPIYVTASGRLVTSVREGDRVAEGDVIAQLANVELEKEVARLHAELAVQRSHIQNLQRSQSRDLPGDTLGSGGQLPTAIEALKDLENRLRDREAEHDRLALRAPRNGIVLPPRATAPDHDRDELATWSGTPLAARNRGAVLESGECVCWVGDPGQQEGHLIVEESDISQVRLGQRVKIYVDEIPARSLTGTVAAIAPWGADQPPPELVAKGLVPVQAGFGRDVTLTSTSYRVVVDLEPHATTIPLRASGRAVIYVAPTTLFKRGYDFLCRTFRLEL